MATTTRGFRYPISTNSPDVPRDIGFLAADIDAMYSATAAISRPAAAKIGREHYATDSGVISLDTGTVWIEKGSRLSSAGLTIGTDVNLYRAAADVLATLDRFDVAGGVIAMGATANQIRLWTDGRIYFGVADDTNLYRAAADTLKTDDSLNIGASLIVQAGLYFGSALDTNLYRFAADTLKTDDALRVVGMLGAQRAVVGLAGADTAGLAGYTAAFEARNYASGIAFFTTDEVAPTYPKFRIDNSGTLQWGPGGATDIDTVLDRGAAGKLETPGSLWVAGAQVMPPGVIHPYAAASSPSGWLLCDGTVYNVVTYPALGALLGATYGGNGTTTFAVPDLRDRVPVGVSGTIARGSTGGSKTHTLTTGEMPAHTHNYEDLVIANATNVRNDLSQISVARDGADLTRTTTSSGGGGAHNNMPPYIGLNFIIKT